MFISLEGTDGSGKSTAARALLAALRDEGHDVLLTREPGGTTIGDQIRTILLDKTENSAMHPRTELLLFCASRAQLVAQVLRPWLARGGIVLCDRYADSTLAYQGYGHGLDTALLRQILHFATGGLQPDVTFYLDVQPEIGLLRRRQAQLFQAEDWNRLDAMEIAFHQRVYAGYESLMQAEPARWQRIDATRPAEEVSARLLALLRPRLPRKAVESPET
ncbi:MAG: dTMP kinase [Anaerolineae bacterium]|jgi:dTMP kinase|nr:dTMP kinase [Anaerolineae bacterium]